MNQTTRETSSGGPRYLQATGRLPHPLTNDYMFKALLQKNKNVLKQLICSLLHLRPDEIESVEIRNPIVLGEALTEDFDSKIFVLDINVLLNNRILINLEMQIVGYENWPERAMTYLCRNFDQLSRGEDYINARPTIHIGFLDFLLFPQYPEFYATYKMMNVKNQHIFTDKFTLSVVNLKHIELATQEDREWKIDYWASLFKAATWEELIMLANQNPILEDAVETIYELTADESIREQCKAREKHIREMNTIRRERELAMQARDKAVQAKDEAVQARDKAVQAKEEAVQARDKAVQAKEEAVQNLNAASQKLEETSLELNETSLKLDETSHKLDETSHKLNEAIHERDKANQQLAQQAREIEQLLQENKRLKSLQK